MSINRAYARQLLYKEFGPDDLGFASTATQVTTTGVVDPTRFGATNENVNRYAFGRIYRPNQAVVGNILKVAGQVSTDTLLHVSNETYTDDLTDLYYEWIRKEFTPDDLNEVVRLALRRIYFETYSPVTPWVDGDMSAPNQDAWIPGPGAPGVIKTQTPTLNLEGFQALLVVNTGSSQWVGQTIVVMPRQRYYLAANCILLQGGPASFHIYDATHGLELLPNGGAPSTLSGVAAHMHGTYTIPDGCVQITCRLQMDAANSIGAWTDLPGHELSGKRLGLPSFINAGFKLIDVLEALHGIAPTSQNVEAHASKQYEPWYRPQDYETEVLGYSANPRTLQINRDHDLPEHDLWLHGWRAQSDKSPLLDETSTTDADEDYVKAALMSEMLKKMMNRVPDARWGPAKQAADLWLDAQRQARRAQTQPRKTTTAYVPGGRPTGRYVIDGRGDW